MELSFLLLWTKMGLIARGVIVVLVSMSIASLTVAAERALWFRGARRASQQFVRRWRAALEGEGWATAARLCSEYPVSPVAQAVGAASDALDRGEGQGAGREASSHAIRRVSVETAVESRRGLPLLATIGSTAPFVGLFGTVVGIVNAFEKMAVTGQGGLATVSAGIAEALVATALGILVAIPAVWIFNALTHEVTRLLALIDGAGEELAEHALAPTRAARQANEGQARGNAA